MNVSDYFTSIEVAICFTALMPLAAVTLWLFVDEYING
tara:strand:- start:385 stop:498 length:114 start_codon:yes stop_codon:yes gene_type:complete